MTNPTGPRGLVRSVLIVSNGRGEDAVGAALAQALAEAAPVAAYPLVGTGDVYGDVPLLDPRQALPSGGFALRGGDLAGDLRAGGAKLLAAQRRTLRGQAGRHAVTVAVGDVFCLWMASRARTPTVFVATAKSQRTEPHRLLEIWQMRRRAAVVFTRDRETAEALAGRGVRARYDGNPLMDCIPPARGALPLAPGAPVVLLLPGSRSDALYNLTQVLKVAVQINDEVGARFVCALSQTIPVVEAVRRAQAAGWEAAGEFIERAETRVLLTRDFGAAVRAATIVVGLAGTANEQAAGLGRPVVAFSLDGAVQYTPRFLALQKRLLGDALVDALDWEDAARAAVWLLLNPEEAARRGAVGRERMGGGGAVEKIAQEVTRLLPAR
ncbi:MAG: lipid-A-disaccharide synthase-related protein [Armatimonadota bacterium]|nr:lipid-A-disaccharide synthase-related protein [Armatimonadota bacterium]MDR7452014.1 lipid-A-disaccharide synthase-related protein [Armatimonadota bacterium]MDR7467905.1 lipid-A-disaccharide synthase-related protein [Armatimonadota bacterium]MDR7494242.1 lipid-A-disaccharide synthase-related protein [Armatimonadota bacterium]MDR7500023.1 lipid-A-disaccharide synthase-related protein [Armatimonadota bacterium]